ncbi:nucleoside hydrolase [Paenibacillus sp. P26]|nr:nucleoside hydrolase [Paenibacillus sp. P26]
MRQKIILDVDTGIDDALAIAYAAGSPEIEPLGVTVTYGNTPLSNAFRNTVEIMKLLKQEARVFKGAEKPLERTKEYSGKFHGSDGLGETLGPATKSGTSPMTAEDFMIEQVHRYGPELTIVTTGPLTNLAKAIKKDPSIASKVCQVVSMGGAVMSPGNVTKFAEANIYMDPEAAQAVFGSESPITLVGLDVTRKTLLAQEDMLRWRGIETEAARLFADFTEYYLDAYKRNYPYLRGCALHDPLAVGVAKNPGWVHTVPMYIQVDLESDALGRTMEDLLREPKSKPNTQVCVQVEAEAFMREFYQIVEKAIG